MDDQSHKPHRRQKEKKTAQPGSINPKAHAFANPGRLQKQAARSHDVREKRLHVPLVDRLPEEAPPLVVGVVGPPQVGKTTLIKSLIRRYTKQTLSAPTGPLTVVTSKRRRLTFIECPSESLASMIDISKVVDIVLLMIDGSFGFEMETMEFLNVLSSSGMPGNVFGILTKLDLFKKQDTLRTRKKQLKHRFWSELYQGAKLFYLSGLVNGRYPDREVLNLSRFLSVMKNPRPLVWRNSHPYCLADRYVDVTPPTSREKNPKCDRTIALYGYLRGTNFPAQGSRIHIPGIGDLRVSDVEALPDPCPTPYQDQASAKATGKKTRRRLGEKQKVLFAPMSDVGGVLMDKDAVYVDIRKPNFDRNYADQGNRGFGEQLVMSLQGDRRLLGEADGGVQLFNQGGQASVEPEDRRRAAPYNSKKSENFSEDGLSDDEDSDEDPRTCEGDTAVQTLSEEESSDADENLAFEDSDSDDNLSEQGDMGSDGDGALAWKNNLAQRAQEMHSKKTYRRIADLSRLMYDFNLTPSDALRKWNGEQATAITSRTADDTDEDDNFFNKRSTDEIWENKEDRTVPEFNAIDLKQRWTDPEKLKTLQKRFISVHLNKLNANHEDDEDGADDDVIDDSDDSLEDDEEGGDFEDLETGEKHERTEADKNQSLEAERERNAKKKEELKLRFEEEDREGFANDKANIRLENGLPEQEFGEDEWYDAQKAKIQKQLDINRAEFDEMDDEARIRVEGYKAGTYARILLENVPYEFPSSFDPRYPLILGGLNPTEERFGFVQARIKRHRWHQRILKNNDPLIFSLGWRRFQTIPIYSTSDSRTRNRMLKYTPEHMHCFSTFYGPLVAPNTGFVCVQSFSSQNKGFRIAATGVVLSVDESTQIVKKLKLKGFPHKIYKNTAIIRDMFASELEAIKFKAANLRTVSGIRGMVKGRAGNQYPDGYIRAGFEDKILKSDIVFLSTWYEIKPREFYMPVTNLLMPPDRKQLEAVDQGGEDSSWRGMRLTGEVRAAQNMPTPTVKDSLYRPIERAERHFNPLRVPRKLAADLPFKSQITQMKPQQKQTYLQKRAVVLGGEEKAARDLMQKIMTLRNEKVAKRRAAQEKRREPHRRKVAEGLEKKEAREKREKAEYWEREGKKRKKTESGGNGGGGGGRPMKRRKK